MQISLIWQNTFIGKTTKTLPRYLLGAVLEDSLRKIADANGVDILNSKGMPLTLDPLNISLAKKGVYNALVQKQITSWANLRNDAAHGHFDRYDSDSSSANVAICTKILCGLSQVIPKTC